MGQRLSTPEEFATCCDCLISVDALEWREEVRVGRSGEGLYILGHDSRVTQSFSESKSISATLNCNSNNLVTVGGGVGATRSDTVQLGQPMAKLFALKREIEHPFDPNSSDYCTRNCWRYGIGVTMHATESRCKTAEEEAKLPKQYRCARCFAEKYTDICRDMLATTFGKMFIIDIGNMEWVNPEVGKLA